MKAPELPVDEESRISALENLGLLFSPAEERFDRITRLAKRLFNVPIAVVSLVVTDIQWFKSCQGMAMTETSREISFCGHAILKDEPMVISDALKHPDFADNPLVTGEPGIRFYAGQAIRFTGKKIGTLCIIDKRPRVLLPSDIDSLCSLALWVESELKLSATDHLRVEMMSNMESAKRKGMIDPVTGTWNQEAMEEVMELGFARIKRSKTPVTILMIEPDNMTYDNNSDQDNTGSIILKEVAQRIRSSIRTHDAIARYDGNRFLVFLENCDRNSSRKIAQNILRNVSVDPIHTTGGQIMTTSSIGIASSGSTDIPEWRKLIEMADSALTDAKKAGGNQCLLKKTG